MRAYQEGTGNEDEDTAIFVAGLSIEGCDLMLDLLEGEFLKQRGNNGQNLVNHCSSEHLLTFNFVMMACVPSLASLSKVSIELSRYENTQM